MDNESRPPTIAEHRLATPVIFLIFNRPTETAAVFAEIRRARPSKLLVIADGPRRDRAGEAELCARTRAVVGKVDWPCEVSTRFSPENRGCKENVASGLDWAFEQVEEAIVLEDDCLPDASFFPFAEELLDRYRDDPRVAQICGSNYQHGIRRTDASYYFSRHAHIWGWATWRRSWQLRDLQMSAWPELRARRWLEEYVQDAKAAFYWRKIFDDSYRGGRDSLNSWAIPWTFSCWARGSLSVIPAENLISNIGYAEGGTHTTKADSAHLTTRGSMSFPLRHPTEFGPQRAADRYTEETFYYGQSLPERLFWALRLPLSVSTVRRARRLLQTRSRPN